MARYDRIELPQPKDGVRDEINHEVLTDPTFIGRGFVRMGDNVELRDFLKRECMKLPWLLRETAAERAIIYYEMHSRSGPVPKVKRELIDSDSGNDVGGAPTKDSEGFARIMPWREARAMQIRAFDELRSDQLRDFWAETDEIRGNRTLAANGMDTPPGIGSEVLYPLYDTAYFLHKQAEEDQRDGRHASRRAIPS